MTNLLQQLLQDAVGTKRGKQIETDLQPFITSFVNPIAGSILNGWVAKSPTLQALLTIAEQPGAPLSGLSTTQTTSSAIDAAIAALAAKISGEIIGPKAAPTSTAGATMAQVVTVYNSALTSLGVNAVTESTLDDLLTKAAAGASTMTEAEALDYINGSLTFAGLPTADDATFDQAFTGAWTAAGYPVPNS